MAFEKKENKDIKITVRFSVDEKDLIDKYIAANDYKNVTEFIRDLVDKAIN